jgi:HAD superfamily hydrolase (TIGR01509 family)
MLRAVLFDFNGVIIDDEHLHHRAFSSVLAEQDVVLQEKEYFERYLGLDDRKCFTTVLEDRGCARRSAAGIEHLVQRKARIYLDLLGDGIPLFAGVQELARELSAHLPLAVVSGALRNEIELVLERTGLAGCFSVIISANDVQASKPDPQGYLTAYEQLKGGRPDLIPGQCLVIEDAPAGILAAHSAGMVCLAVANSRPAEQLSKADAVVLSLEGLSYSALEEIVESAAR